MSQYDFGNLSSPLSPTVFFDTHMESWRNALHSNHSGSSAPSYQVAGTAWLDTTTSPWVWKMYDGADQISFGLFDTSANTFGLVAATIGANTTQRHTVPAVASDTVALIAATQTLTNKTITSGRYNQLLDTNGNVMLGMTPTASAVNYVNITNNATGGNPVVAAAGTDTNVNLNLSAKGTGNVRAIPGSGSNVFQIFNGATTAAASLSVASLTASRTFTLPDTAMTFAGSDVAQTFTQLQTMSVGANVGNAAQAATTTLDWYEEGSFTPTLVGLSTAGTGTYTTQYGRYTRVGRVVHYQIGLGWSAHTGTGNMRISGLPFTSVGLDQAAPISYYDALTVGAGLQLGATHLGSSTNINLYSLNPAGAAAGLAMDTAVTLILLNGSYIV